MAFDELERAGGKPVEVYRFTYGARVWRWTSGDSAIMVDGEVYFPEPLTRGRVEMNEEARTGSVDVKAPASNEVVRLFAKSQPTTRVLVEIFRVQLDDLTLEPDPWFTGEVQSCRYSPRVGTLHCAPAEGVTSRKLAVLTYQTTCNNALFDQRCQVDPTYFTYELAIQEILPPMPGVISALRYQLEPGSLALFTGDLVAVLTGGVAKFGDERQMITAHFTDTIWMLAPLSGVYAGDVLTLSAGCPKTVSACRDVFDNLARFNGFPNIPQDNPFQGTGGLE